MTEDQNDQSTGQPVEGSAEAHAPSPTPETTEDAIALPATTPPPPAEPLAMPQQPVTPPMGVTDDAPAPAPDTTPSTPPQGTYAMGALAGNPNLAATSEAPAAGAGSAADPNAGAPYQGAPYQGAPYAGAPYGGTPYGGVPYGAAYGGPPTDPNAPMWPAPPATGVGGSHTNHKTRNALLAGAAAVAVLAAGVGIGHAAWNNSPTNLSSSPASGSGQTPSGSGSNGNGSTNPFGNGSTNPFGNGSPFGGGFSGGNGSGSNGGGSSSSGSGGPSDVDAIASKIDPGLVDINTTLGYQQEQAAGTGIVLTSNGVVLTNNHVINGATSISVTDVGNKKTYTASVVGYDRTKDIAVLQLHNASGLQTATIASSNASVGQQVVGVGNAGGTGGTPSAAGGTITALNQSITASDEGDGTSEQLSGLIQTNADIQPGDSGGALVNTAGEVIGVDTAASAGFSFDTNESGNQGFAIPINAALSIAKAIEAGSASSTIHIGQTAFLGVEIQAGGGSSDSGNSGNSGDSGNTGNGFGGFGGFGGNSGNTGSSSSVSGATIAGVVTNGPAQEAGLAQGDVITSLGGKTIASANDVTNAMGAYHPGDKVTIGWTDTSGQHHSATVQLSSGPPQ